MVGTVDWNCSDHPHARQSVVETEVEDLVKVTCNDCKCTAIKLTLEWHESRCQQCEDVFEPPLEEAHLFCKQCRAVQDADECAIHVCNKDAVIKGLCRKHGTGHL
jgi:hypothetical protein